MRKITRNKPMKGKPITKNVAMPPNLQSKAVPSSKPRTTSRTVARGKTMS